MNKNLVFVIAPKDFRDEELFIPLDIVKKAGIETKIASTILGKCLGSGGRKITSQFMIDNIKADDYDGIVFIGGSGMTQLVDNSDLQNLAKEFFQNQKLVAAICVAPVVLAKAEILKNISATAWQDYLPELQEHGCNVVAKPVVIAGRVITGNGPLAAQAFGQAITKYLQEIN